MWFQAENEDVIVPTSSWISMLAPSIVPEA